MIQKIKNILGSGWSGIKYGIKQLWHFIEVEIPELLSNWRAVPRLMMIAYAYAFMEAMQNDNIGYLAVSLGFYKTLFSAPGSSTSSEIPENEQKEMGLSDGLVRFSVGLDNDIKRTYNKMKDCMQKIGVIT